MAKTFIEPKNDKDTPESSKMINTLKNLQNNQNNRKPKNLSKYP